MRVKQGRTVLNRAEVGQVAADHGSHVHFISHTAPTSAVSEARHQEPSTLTVANITPLDNFVIPTT